MGENVMLIVAEKDDKLVAGALNIIGGDTLFGRLWGCLPDAYFPDLHFEARYYQVIICSCLEPYVWNNVIIWFYRIVILSRRLKQP